MITLSNLIKLPLSELLNELWNSDITFYKILLESKNLSSTRNKIFSYIDAFERKYFNIFSEDPTTDIHIIERNCAKECTRVLKNVFRSENERLTGFSALKTLIESARNNEKVLSKTSKGFYCEFIYLFHGINLATNSYMFKYTSEFVDIDPVEREKRLDNYSLLLNDAFSKFEKGTNPNQIQNQKAIKNSILKAFNGTEAMWNDYRWHLQHLICTKKTIEQFITLESDEIAGLEIAEQNNIPVQITPFYLSLFNQSGRTIHDRTLRAQVIPSELYCRYVLDIQKDSTSHDYMDEQHSSPISGITRRYPQIVILKPFDSCPQICVYCQRNWEITSLKDATSSRDKIENAINWIKNTPSISEVLVTGGDPLTLNDKKLEWILSSVCSIPHVERIRIGTRTLLTMPSRFTPELLSVLEKFHQWGSKEIAIMTHCEHPLEITPEVLDAIKKIKRTGINIYNQQVFTYYNSRRFETCYLRKICKLSGIDPYYSFNTKGKAETIDFRIPIARIEQERKEEARLLPGLVRTDEPVFNIPRLGKSHLRAWQDHEPIMINADGTRVYRFYPWESRHAHEDDYLYTDVSIYDYCQRLKNDGEDVDDYESIWYYF